MKKLQLIIVFILSTIFISYGFCEEAFQQQSSGDYLVSMEAENYDSLADFGGDVWGEATTLTGYQGTGYMIATPNDGTAITSNITTTSPRMDYKVRFTQTGTHYVWALVRGGSADDSFHVGLNGSVETEGVSESAWNTSTWVWGSDTVVGGQPTINVTSTGVHTFNIWMREDGTAIDKIVLTPSASGTYTPTGAGPTESERTDDPVSYTIPICPQCITDNTFDLFVSTGGNDSTGDGSKSSPYLTVEKALSEASAGDLIGIEDGDYAENQLVVPVGVSITSVSQDNKLVEIYPSQDYGATDPFIKLDSTSNTDGNQYISHIEFDGVNGSYEAQYFIRIRNRNNVSIHNCHIHDFSDGTTTYTSGHYGIRVESNGEFTYSGTWTDYWPDDAEEPGDDSNIDAVWPSGDPVSNFKLYKNTITDIEAVQLWHLKDSSIYNNTIDNIGTNFWAILGTPAFLWNVDIYNNILYGEDQGSARSDYIIETWLHRGGCLFANNTLNGNISITTGKETYCFNNTITHDPLATSSSGRGYGIEFVHQSHGVVHGNYIHGAQTGIDIGIDGNVANDGWIVEYTNVRNNIIYAPQYHGILLKSQGSGSGSDVLTAQYFNIYNNTIDSNDSRGSNGIYLLEDDNGDVATLTNVNVKNNIMTDIAGYPGKDEGTVSTLSIDYNLFYSNTYSSWNGSSATNTVTTDPNYLDNDGGDYIDYTPISSSGAIDAGTDVGMSYAGSAPDIGAIETY